MRLRVVEGSVWRYYNCPDPWWSSKCRACREKVALLRAPVEECVNCWKVEIWKRGAAFVGLGALDFDRVMDRIDAVVSSRSELRPESSRADAREPAWPVVKPSPVAKAPPVAKASLPVAKASRAPIQVVSTGVPREGYGVMADEVGAGRECSQGVTSFAPVDDLLVLYAKSISERELLRDLVRDALGLSAGAAELIPVRRGCWRFDRILGPWQEWYPVHSDWRQ